MPEFQRFLLSYGERLTERRDPPGGGGAPQPAYGFDEAVTRLTPMIQEMSNDLQDLPAGACPEDEAVGLLNLHPQSIAKSYHPRQLFSAFDLRQVGSRPVIIQPEKWTRKTEPQPAPATQLFVAGRRQSFRAWADTFQEGARGLTTQMQEQVRRLESVRSPTIADRLRGPDSANSPERSTSGDSLLEVVLHASSAPSAHYILAAFEEYALALDARPDFDRRLYAGGLCFLPVEADVTKLSELLRFSFLRVARPMPRLRRIVPVERAEPLHSAAPCPLPSLDAVDTDLRVAIFDGGLDPTTELARWADAVVPPGVGNAVDELSDHGHAVTSALLFGSLVPGTEAPRPYARIEHYQVLDDKSESDPYELYDVLRRIQNVLSDRKHEFFNLSIGPALPVEDDEVHLWTAVLDEYLSDGSALASIAVGNNGGNDRASGEARIQVPADCVNAMGIGAADSSRKGWTRAEYSAVGPGRSPGRVKPDLLHFGGGRREPFVVYDMESVPALAATCGTSFAAPAALRNAVGLRAHFGTRISPLGLKALLVHQAESNDLDRSDVGWGAISESLENFVICEEGSVRILYQGELSPAQYLRALIPLPQEQVKGLVSIAATFCYATPTDPQDPGSYTRSGLQVVFRPHAAKFKDGSTEPTSRPFFQRSDYDDERTLRSDGQKWETTMRASQTLQGRSLFRPVFDIHYNARSFGGQALGAEKMRYALVVTLTAKKMVELYEIILRDYAGRLEVLKPRLEIPVRI